MRINYDQQEDALYIRFYEAPYEESDEVRPGVIVDYDGEGRVIGMEILDVSHNAPASFLHELLRAPEMRVPVQKRALA